MPAEAEEEQPHGVEEHRANNSKQPAEAGGESGHVVLKNTARASPEKSPGAAVANRHGRKTAVPAAKPSCGTLRARLS